MELSLSEKLTYCTVRLVCRKNDTSVSIGTGFIVNVCAVGDKVVPLIVTNKHVIDGADTVEFEFCLKKEDGSPDDLNVHRVKVKGGWILHPDPDVDLCCFPIASVLNLISSNKTIQLFYLAVGLDLLPPQETIEKLGAMEEIVMIGYPIGLMDDFNHKPIIRRGITATHIKKKYHGKNQFLVDMACFPGSSGSPIFIANEGSFSFGNDLQIGQRLFLVGILYGGPQYNAEGEIVFSSIPTAKSKTNIPTNLGVAIRSDELRVFENIISPLLKKQ